MPIPGEWAMAPASYSRFVDQCQRYQGQTDKDHEAPLADQLSHRLNRRYNSSTTSARGIEYCHLKGPGMQKGSLPAAAACVWEGSRCIIRPQHELSTYRTEAEETFNATDMSMRSSVTTMATDVAKRPYHGPEDMPSFEDWVLTKPLGRQLLEDPPEVLEKLQDAYERHIAHMISVRGGSHAHKCVYGSEWQESRIQQGKKHPEAAANARPSSRTWNYSDVPKQALRMRACHGDIPAWAPKEYETSALLEGSRAWPDVSMSGKDCGARPKPTQWASLDLSNSRVPISSERRSNADIRLAVPVRETLGNKHMASHLLSINRRIDHHGELCGHTHPTPLAAALRTRAISLSRNLPVS
jgi:hypothetical protein